MRRYKILARILLMFSVIDFALAAPVAVQKHEVRVSMVDTVKDGTATSPLRRDLSDKNAADRTNALPPIPRSSDSGHWREQEPRQYNPRPRTDSNDSPEPSNPAPPNNNNPLRPSPPDSRPLRPGPSHDDLDGSKSLSELMSTPTHDTPPPDGSPQIASSPDRSPSFSSWLQADSHSGSTSSWSSGESWESWSSGSTTEESYPPSPGQIDHPPPASPPEPGPSTRPRPPAGAVIG
jgi:hypothetical protein